MVASDAFSTCSWQVADAAAGRLHTHRKIGCWKIFQTIGKKKLNDF